jgi:hypothetical protein
LIKIDFSVGKEALSKRTGSTTALFLNSIAAGNLLLVGDRAAEARDYFVQAGIHADDAGDTEQALSLAVERIASSMRAEDGSPLRAVEFIRNMQSDGSLPPALGPLGAVWKKADLHDAALRVSMDPHQQTQPMFTATGAIPETSVFTIPGESPLLLTRLAPQSDSDLRAWLENWRQAQLAGKGVDAQQCEQLRGIIERTRLDTSTVSAIGDVFRDVSNDPVASVEFYRPIFTRGDEGPIGPWLQQWLDSVAARKSVDENEQKELRYLLAKSTLSCQRVYEIGHAFCEVTSDELTTAIFYAASIRRGDQELKEMGQYDASTKDVLSTMKNCEHLLWDVSFASHTEYIDALDMLCHDVAQWVPNDDPSLGWMKGWAKIGIAECLYENGDIGESLSYAQTINSQELNDEQVSGLAWIRGLALFASERYHEAASQFFVVMHHPSYQHARQASGVRVISLARDGDLVAANQALSDMIQLYHPNERNLARLAVWPALMARVNGRLRVVDYGYHGLD